MKNFYLSAKLFVSLCLAGFTNTAYAQNEAPRVVIPFDQATEKATVELLEDPFFYSFNDGKPTHWATAGTVTQLKAGDRYSSDTGFGVGIETAANVEGYLKQVIDLNRAGKEVVQGDELECLVHYSTIESKRLEGPFRLALRWLDVAGNELVSTEKDFINNPDIYFGRMKAYGDLKFRTVCPAGAVKLEFTLLVAPGSLVRMDDFSVLRLADKDKTPLVAILPQYRTMMGEVGQPTTFPIALQGMHLSADQTPNFGGTMSSSVMKLDVEKLPKNGTVKANLTITPQVAGVYVGSNTYKLRFSGADEDNSGSLNLTGYFKRAGTTPTITLKANQQVREMKAAPGKTDEQQLDFDIKDVITNVNLALKHDANSPFRIDVGQYYYATSSGKLYHRPVKVTFAPRKAGVYEAELRVSSVLADTLVIKLKGVSEAATSADLVESFTENRTMDGRFTGDAWKGYHKFDLGYWKLNGKWNSKSNVTLIAKDTLYYDELIANGVNTLQLTPASSAAKCTAEYSIDGGGHWKSLTVGDGEGKYVVGTHRPTLVRFVSSESVEVQSVTITPNTIDEREAFDKIEEVMLKDADSEPLAVLNETFSDLRHTRILGLKGWQNLTVRGERPFYAWKQKNADQSVVENEVAQISFLKYGVEDRREHESWLISPTLSYKNAQSKDLTFSLMYRNQTTNGEELFGFYIITEKDGKATPYFLDISEYVPAGVKLESDMWFDYRIDLSKVEGLTIEDKFHVAFSYYSPVGGNATSLNFMLDDVTFGRTDLPELSVDNDFIQFVFRPGQEMTPQPLNIYSNRTTAPVTITLAPSTQKKYFKLSSEKLPLEGGALAVGFKSNDSKTHAAALLVQTRGAEPIIVKLLAQPITAGISNVAGGDEDALLPVVSGSELTVNGKYQKYQLFSTDGSLLQQGGYQQRIDLSGVQPKVFILKLSTDEGVKSFTLKR
ncbi:choice-of-anchor J domain-containing protein [Prevotella melaninogenica]|uniref:Discoidin domain-containing protein n=1 Tax=Prevotella melaninogenica TaxID=28132 RepID=A0A250KJ51_9BACT|nr:choice-of-anchor J domain-containing protein [Prevotella melaninogenica]BBA29085.1 hypothetical protein PMEL1_01008 [Prevotella melaninogenica]